MSKRFRVILSGISGLYVPIDDWNVYNFRGIEGEYDCTRIVDLLNDLNDENEQLQFENNELKCALALYGVDYIIADGKKIDIPPYYEFEQRYDTIMHRREYDGYD